LSLPAPPAKLPPRPPRYELPAQYRWVRIYKPKYGAWNEPRSLGPVPGVRFDHHRPPFGSDTACTVWYAASSLAGALAEAFGNAGVVDRSPLRRLAVVRVEGRITVLDLVGTAARFFGLDQRIATWTDSDWTQSWARAFHGAYPDLEGFRWRGRQGGSLCFVLNERADMSSLVLESDHELGETVVWPRVVRAARRAHLKVV